MDSMKNHTLDDQPEYYSQREYWSLLTRFLNGTVTPEQQLWIELPWLRVPTSATPARRRRVLALLTKLKELANPSCVTAAVLQTEVNQMLAKYPVRYVAEGTQIQPRFTARNHSPQAWAVVTEADIAAMLIQMANQGTLDLLKTCAWCGWWFVASRKNRQFCTESCKRKHQSSSPEYKKKRAAYMRERYQDEMKGL